MPYVCCPTCGLHTFTAAYWSSVDHCGRCDAELPRPARPAPDRPEDVEDAVRERLYGGPRMAVDTVERRRSR
jgi:hypothetical protein